VGSSPFGEQAVNVPANDVIGARADVLDMDMTLPAGEMAS
jgi:hypothetical protein